MTPREPKLTPAMRQWREAKDKHPDKVILFRMGDFYETFNEDAELISRLLGLTLTRRGRDADPTPLAGVPHHQIDRYVRELINKGVSVVIVDQLEDPAEAKGVVRRGITRVLTPGTVVDDDILPVRAHNYLAAAAAVRTKGRKDPQWQAAAAFVDLSTGDFFITMPDPARLADEFERHAPAETLVARDAAADPSGPLAVLLARGSAGGVTRRDPSWFDPNEGRIRLLRRLEAQTLDALGLTDAPAALGAAGALLAYLEENQPDNLGHIKPPVLRDYSGTLLIDRNTIRNLELVPRHAADKNPSLLGIVDNTLTGPGARLLRDWLLRPPCTLERIQPRQTAAAALMQNTALRAGLRAQLKTMADLERIASRLQSRRTGPAELWRLAQTCRCLPVITGLLAGCDQPLLRDAATLDTMDDIAAGIEATLADDPPPTTADGGYIRPGYSAEVDELREIKNGGKDWLRSFQQKEQTRTGIPSLKVGYNKVFGYFIEITNAHKDKVPPDYERKQTLVNAERYITPELKAMEDKVLGAEQKLQDTEIRLFVRLRDAVAEHTRRMQAVAECIARLDVVQSLAEAGALRGWVFPELHEGLDTLIEEGRHPVLEALLPTGAFVANDCRFDPDAQRILIITGPNMAGKSTYIRQVALIIIMAHMGCPVPAKAARIGLADRVFSRVGASDDLAAGRSTFMVEMVETAEILHNATQKSVIILDEVGRGTSTFDGVSLAWSLTEYLHQKIMARTLFATHYHELAELGFVLERAKNYTVAVREHDNSIVFLRRIQPGACDRSYGIQVGKMAGIPHPVIRRAGEILASLEAQARERDNKLLKGGSKDMLRAAAREVQGELFAPPEKTDELARRILRELADTDPNLLSPMDAHALLARLAARARGKP